jgi:hypothetical protein
VSEWILPRGGEQTTDELLVITRGPPWFATSSGIELDPEKVAAGMEKERESLKRFCIGQPATRADMEADRQRCKEDGTSFTLVNSGWVLTQKDSGLVKARFVATEVAYAKATFPVFTSSPTVISQRFLMSQALKENQPIIVGDVATAFLHAPLPHGQTTYVKVPACEYGTWPGGYIKLQQALYGLRAAPKAFQDHFAALLQRCGWYRFQVEPQLYRHAEMNALLSVYADDLLITAPEQHLQAVRQSLEGCVAIKWGDEFNSETWTKYLGLEWRRVGATLQCRPRPDYFQELFDHYGLGSGGRKPTTPLAPTTSELLQDEPESASLSEEAHCAFRRAIGKLMWVLPSRPDLCFSVKELARVASQPCEQDRQQLVHLLRYIRSTIDNVLQFVFDPEAGPDTVSVNTDASWASSRNGRSTTGAILSLQGIILTAFSRTQTSIALSSAEAELVAVSTALSEAILVGHILEELQRRPQIVVKTDATAAMGLMQKRGPGRLRHLQIRHLWVQDLVASGLVKCRHISSTANTADILTKALAGPRFQTLRAQLGVVSLAQVQKQEEPEETHSIAELNMVSTMPSRFLSNAGFASAINAGLAPAVSQLLRPQNIPISSSSSIWSALWQLAKYSPELKEFAKVCKELVRYERAGVAKEDREVKKRDKRLKQIIEAECCPACLEQCPGWEHSFEEQVQLLEAAKQTGRHIHHSVF